MSVALMAGALAACSPAPEGVVAVEAVNGAGARLLTMTCSGFTANRFSVYQDDASDELREWAVIRDLPEPRVSSVQVFQEPDGWRTYESKLSRFQAGSTYVAKVNGGVGAKAVSGELRFGADQVRGLAEGQVLTSDGDGGTVTVNRDDFLKAVDDYCRDLAS